MPPPSKLSISTSALQRLLKEESSYHKELEQQQARLSKLETTDQTADENAEFMLKQQRKAIQETEAMFPAIRQRIMVTASQLDQLLTANDQEHPETEVAKAQEVLAQAKNLQ